MKRGVLGKGVELRCEENPELPYVEDLVGLQEGRKQSLEWLCNFLFRVALDFYKSREDVAVLRRRRVEEVLAGKRVRIRRRGEEEKKTPQREDTPNTKEDAPPNLKCLEYVVSQLGGVIVEDGDADIVVVGNPNQNNQEGDDPKMMSDCDLYDCFYYLRR